MERFGTSFVSLNSWMPFFVTMDILSLFSSLKDIASFVSSLLKTIKSALFVNISSLCGALHFQPFFLFGGKKTKIVYKLFH